MPTINVNTELSEIQQKLCKFLLSGLPPVSWVELQNKIRERYSEDAGLSLAHFPNTSRRSKPQLHRYGIDEVFVDIFGLDVLKSTNPQGEIYCLFSNANISLSHYLLNPKETLRSARHRRSMTDKNKILEPYNYDLFDDPQRETLDKTIHAAILIQHSDRKPSEALEPEGIFIEIPYSDWKGSHLLIEVNRLVEMQETVESDVVPDLAFSELKKELFTIESGEGESANKG